MKETPEGFVDIRDSDGGDPNVITVDAYNGNQTSNFFVDQPASAIPSSSPSDAPTMPAGPPTPIISVAPSTQPSVEPSRKACLGAISGNVSDDVNNDDTGDENLTEVLVTLRDSEDNTSATTLTDTFVNYAFFDLPCGEYEVIETNPDEYLDVKDVDGGDPNSITIMIGSGNDVNSTKNNFVDEKCRKVSGEVLEDVDNNGTGDTGMNGVIVELCANGASETLLATRYVVERVISTTICHCGSNCVVTVVSQRY